MTELTLPLDNLTLSLTPGPEALWLNLNELRRTNTLVQGFTRAGKSYLVRWLCEQLFPEMQQIIFDVEGEYVSLTEKFDYALFSAETPVTPNPDAAPLLMRRLLELGTPAIFDLSEMPLPEQQRFTAAACAALVQASPRVPRSVLVVLDEVQRLAPQAGQGEAASTQAVRDLANRGLKRGISLLTATQRHSSVDAGLRGAMANLVVGGTPPGLDMETAGKKLGFDSKSQRRLAALKRGEFFFLGPAFGDPNADRQVYQAKSGLVQTHHLDAGEARTYTPPPASEAMEALYTQLGDLPGDIFLDALPADIAAVSDDQGVKSLLARIAVLETENARLGRLEAENARVPGLEAELARLHAALLPQAAQPPVAQDLAAAPLKAPVAAAPTLPAASPAGPVNKAAGPVNKAAGPVRDKEPRTLPAKVNLRRLELVLSEFHPYALTLPQLGALTNMDLSGASGQNAVRALRRDGLAAWDGARLSATEKGRRTNAQPMTAETYRRRWEEVLGATPSRLLWALEEAVRAGISSITFTEWLDWAAYSKGGPITAARARLVTLGFVAADQGRYSLTGDWPRDANSLSEENKLFEAPKLLLRLEGGGA